MHETLLVGEAVAGASAKTRAVLESLIKNIEKQQFDVAELLYQVQLFGLYAPDFNTYKEYTRSLGLKDRKAEYLPKIVKVMGEVGIPREKYEKLGIGRLRAITSLDPSKDWTNPETGQVTPIKEFIAAFVEKGEEIEMEDLLQNIRTLKGLVGENDLTWLNLCFQRSVLDSTVRPAIDKMKAIIGSQGKDADGVSIDASDAKAVEMMSAEILADETLGGV